MAPASSIWTDSLVEALRQYVAKGWAASRIANEIHVDHGVLFSRSAILGKIFRLGLGGWRPKPPPPQHPPRASRQRKSRRLEVIDRPVDAAKLVKRKLVPRPVDDEAIPKRRHKTLWQLTDNTCRWPIGSTGLYCGAKEADLRAKRPYCAWHQQQAWERRRHN